MKGSTERFEGRESHEICPFEKVTISRRQRMDWRESE